MSARIQFIPGLLGIVALISAAAANADEPARNPLSYEDCSTIVSSLTAMRYDREDGPIAEYLDAVASDLEKSLREADRFDWPVCPSGFRAGDSNGSVACFASGSRFGKYPNVHFDPPTAPRITRHPDGTVEACSRAHYLIYSYAFGDQERELCARAKTINGELLIERSSSRIASRQAELAAKVLEACGTPPPDECR